jgi:hypothetical protein
MSDLLRVHLAAALDVDEAETNGLKRKRQLNQKETRTQVLVSFFVLSEPVA